ncbi:MAG: histidine triad nucleotide-binding protein [Spirochaetes bacterium]|nr:histidine triad nucleotide-binding protein [Spirochaetota bacterium]MBX3721611.1 histidine triad nucleotide-binding protein [Turneriella sp.]
MSDCLFCKIAEKKIHAKIVYEDDHVLAFRDINPVAPTHILLIPRTHMENILGLGDDTAKHMLAAMRQIVADEKIEKGFRLVSNTGEHGGQTVYHLHWHILSGRHMGWPPG